MITKDQIATNRIKTLKALTLVFFLWSVIFCFVSVYQTLEKDYVPGIIFGLLSVGFTFMAVWNHQIAMLSKIAALK